MRSMTVKTPMRREQFCTLLQHLSTEPLSLSSHPNSLTVGPPNTSLRQSEAANILLSRRLRLVFTITSTYIIDHQRITVT